MNTNSMQGIIDVDQFSTAHYGIRIGNLRVHSLLSDIRSIKHVVEIAKGKGFQVLFTRIASTDSRQKVFLKESDGKEFGKLLSLKREFDGSIQNLPHFQEVRIEAHEVIASASDIDTMRKISATAFPYTHLFMDSRLPKKATQKLYADWAENNAKGRAQKTIIAKLNNMLIGFLNLQINENDEEFKGKKRGRIDLLAVAEEFRGQGVGKSLLAKGIEWFSQNCQLATVGTEYGNPALRLYQRFGFQLYKTEETYHIWLD